MFHKLQPTLTGALATNGTLVLKDVDSYRLLAAGPHSIKVNNVLYVSPTDFTVAADGQDQATITWLAGATLAIGAKPYIALAMIDTITQTQAAGGGGGGGDASAANQTSVQAVAGSDAAKATAVQGITGGKPVSVTSGPPTSVTALISSGGSLSAAAQVDGKIAGILIPTAWTAAGISFQASQDGTNYFNIYDQGVERSEASANIPTTNGRFLGQNLSDWIGVKYVKIRSGLSAAAVNQGADRTITFILAG